MLIGLTYDLKDDYLGQGFTAEQAAEFDTPETIEAIETALKALGYETERIGHIKALVKALDQGKRWDLVFNIAEGIKGIAREAQVPGLLDAYEIPYTFSSPDVLIKCMDKALAKLLVKDAGVATAPFAVVKSKKDIETVTLPYPLFVKPLAEGSSKGISPHSVIASQESLKTYCVLLLEKTSHPVLVESYLPGREFTVGMLGTGKATKVIGIMEVVLETQSEPEGRTLLNKEGDWKNPENFTLLEEGKLRDEIETLCLKAWTALGCRDSGRIDVRCNARGQPYFIEANPLAGLNPHTSDLPLLYQKTSGTYQDLIATILQECNRRTGCVEDCDIAV